jgi:hypothetical protein
MQVKAVPWKDVRRIDAHNHVWNAQRGTGGPWSGHLDVRRAERLLVKGDVLGIDLCCVSAHLMDDAPTPDEVRTANDVVLQPGSRARIRAGAARALLGLWRAYARTRQTPPASPTPPG